MKKDTTPVEKQLKHTYAHTYMKDTDPMNPFGVNYEEMAQETKIRYKFNTISNHVHFDKEDQDLIENANFEYLRNIVLAISCSGVAAYLTKNQLLKRMTPKIY